LFVVQVVVTLNSFIKPFKSYYKVLNNLPFMNLEKTSIYHLKCTSPSHCLQLWRQKSVEEKQDSVAESCSTSKHDHNVLCKITSGTT